MARLAVISLVVGALALPAALAPVEANAASCSSRKATGTVLGGLGGALVGNAISDGGGGLIVGGVGGALIGRQIGKSGCRKRVTTTYYDSGPRAARAAQPAPVQTVYYDHMGNPVARGEVRNGTFQTVSTGSNAACRTETRSYYDERGRLTERPVQICAR
ncbi:hypothetical protein [Caulobacter sp. RHG1]|uniref:hypothetical protein n=1 Tax=Caulobacter sp. (strain RHG1) TaxID=2545762 RepID=UPI00155532D4|nr:hypothetical protein [Caulobacter sp. RHG1]NQE60654.1 hypothetical protein [Caulobacter sp. RHG1]